MLTFIYMIVTLTSCHVTKPQRSLASLLKLSAPRDASLWFFIF